MRGIFALAALGLSISTVAAQQPQQVTIGQLIDLSYDNRYMLNHIGSTWDGISWTTAYVDANYGVKIICVPGKLVIGDETARDFLVNFIKEDQSRRDLPVNQLGYLLIQAGQATFPCSEP